MSARSVSIAVIFAMLPSIAWAQDLEARVKNLEADILELRAENKKLKNNANVLGSSVVENASSMGGLTETIKKMQEKVGDDLLNLNAQMGKISRDVGGSRELRFDHIQSAEGKEEFSDLLHSTIRTRGMLKIYNKMAAGQWIAVNNTQNYLQPGESKEFDVPMGMVTLKLPGQEIVHWTIDAPDYEKSIDIVPTQQQSTKQSTSVRTTNYPVPYTYVNPPVTYRNPFMVWDPWLGGYVLVR